jgi:adenylate kinase family enzyme
MHVVLLLGSSTAGKSSLCRELVTTHGWKSSSIDEMVDKIVNMSPSDRKLFMFEKLDAAGVIQNLQTLMTEEEMLTLCSTGVLTISKGNHLITAQEFPNPLLPNLEDVLKKAGFIESEISKLAKELRFVTKIDDPTVMLYDDVFDKGNSGQSIVIDLVPNPDESAKKCLEHFQKRAQQYSEENPSETLTTSIVFAYCPVQKLSERIQERNRKADIDNPMDKRVGLFPFHQLATLVTADKLFDDSSEHVLSRNELFYMVNKHANTDKNGDSLFLESPVDPDALQQSYNEEVQIAITSDRVVKLQINDDSLELSSDDLPRIGSKKTIEEYSNLANKFGFFENRERASLNISAGIDFDAVINTAKGNPATLANEFLEKLEKSKISSERVSTL